MCKLVGVEDGIWINRVVDVMSNDQSLIQHDVPLGPMTWYGVGGAARDFVQPVDVAMLQRLLSAHVERGDSRVYILGSGANLLVRDCGVAGLVIRLDTPGFQVCTIEDTRVTVGAGYDLFKLVRELAKAGLGGLEGIAGVPASVGGAVRMNAGGAFGEIGDHVESLRVMTETGEIRTLGREQAGFGYRHSEIQEPIILDVTLALQHGDAQALSNRVKEIFQYKKNVQPMGADSAGCAFKNPDDPDEPGKRLSAGKLIDQAGLKGFQIGGARVSEVHGNFIEVIDKSARADDVLAVIEHVEKVVQNHHEMKLQREVVVWP